jgi:hypothetical protein
MGNIEMKQHYETMFVTVAENKLDDPNHHTAIADMTGYIERMGGTTPEEELVDATTSTEGLVRYEWVIPSHWAGRLYERFRSFGLHAKVKPDSMWFGLLCEICEMPESPGEEQEEDRKDFYQDLLQRVDNPNDGFNEDDLERFEERMV